MSRVLCAAIVALGALASAASSAAAPGTVRLDYFHTGGRGVEIFAVDRVVREPLPWPGHPERVVDDGEAGVYRFEVREASGALLYARGFASIFGEWITTAEAADRHRTFHESLRFPEPVAPAEVVVLRRQPDQSFATVWRTTVDPRDAFVERAPPPRQELIPIEQNGDPADKVDLLLLGEGYTAADCAAGFATDARRMADALFEHAPFAARRADFNLWGLCPPAAESGIARPSAGIHRRTPVGAFQGANYDARAYYRPQLDCVMFTRNVVPFCQVCQRALEQVIDLYAGARPAD